MISISSTYVQIFLFIPLAVGSYLRKIIFRYEEKDIQCYKASREKIVFEKCFLFKNR